VTVYHLPHLQKGPIVPLPGKAIQAAVSKDFHTLAVAFEDGDLRRVLVWDLTAKAQRRIFGEFRGRLSKMEFSPDSTVLMVGWDQREIALWSVTEDKALPSPPRDPVPDSGPSPFFSPHSTRLFINRGLSKDLQMWDWSNGQLSIVYKAPLAELWALGFSPDGSMMAAGWGGEMVALTDTKDFKSIGELRSHEGYIISVAFSPSGRLLATAGRDRTAKLWDPNTRNELASLVGNEQQLRSVVFTPDGESVVTLGMDGEIKVWKLSTVLQRGVILSATNFAAGLALSADERVLATSSDSAVQLWDLDRRVEIRSIPTDESGPCEIAFSPKEPLLAFLGGHSLGLVNYQSGQSNLLRISAPGNLRCPVFSPDGRDLAFTGETNIMFCELATLKLRSFARCDRPLMNFAFSPDGSLLASGHEGGGLSLWNRINGRLITNIVVFAHEDFGPYVDFSRDGRFLASSGGGPTGTIWEVTPTGLKLYHTLRGDLAWFGPFRFLPDGRRGISRSNSILKLWDVEAGVEVGTLYSHRGLVNQLAFSHDGNTIYSLCADGNVRTWRAPPLSQFPIPAEIK
ncbi:MAG: WD40 repeat domain-containing protein, partial [Candidatus Dormibacteraceae bacterium]